MNGEATGRARERDVAWAILFARLVLGLLFFMAGVWKVFSMGALEHARQLFVEPYADTFLPVWALWTTGTVVPFVELLGGVLLLAGYRTRLALLALGGVLVLVTFGHLLDEPLAQLHRQVLPRLALLVFLLYAPAGADRFGLDAALARRNGAG
ncbi:MAG: DoxX family membrane protein [Gemmatimonadota bacterium]